MGRKTYDWVTKEVGYFPHADKTSFIITRTQKPNEGKTYFYTGGLKDLIRKLKNESGKTIFVDGGAEIANEMLKENLIDEFIISVIPILLGNGTPLFKTERPEENLKLLETKTFDTGLVQLHYSVLNS